MAVDLLILEVLALDVLTVDLIDGDLVLGAVQEVGVGNDLGVDAQIAAGIKLSDVDISFLSHLA